MLQEVPSSRFCWPTAPQLYGIPRRLCSFSRLHGIGIDLAVHCYIAKEVPAASITTFVDDWKTRASRTEDAVRALGAAERFADSWDLIEP